MYSVDDIFARLQKGDDPNAIAQEMADALNGALERKSAEDAERQANIQKREKQMSDARDICDLINAFLSEYYGVDEKLSAEDLVDCCDQVNQAIGKLESRLHKLEALFSDDKSKSKSKKDDMDADAAIEGFLRTFGL